MRMFLCIKVRMYVHACPRSSLAFGKTQANTSAYNFVCEFDPARMRISIWTRLGRTFELEFRADTGAHREGPHRATALSAIVRVFRFHRSVSYHTIWAGFATTRPSRPLARIFGSQRRGFTVPAAQEASRSLPRFGSAHG